MAAHGPKITKQEGRWLALHYPRLGPTACAEKLKRPYSMVFNYARRRGIVANQDGLLRLSSGEVRFLKNSLPIDGIRQCAVELEREVVELARLIEGEPELVSLIDRDSDAPPLEDAIRLLKAFGIFVDRRATADQASHNQRFEHPDDAAVDAFAVALKATLAEARTQGRQGWEDSLQFKADDLADMLARQLTKGNASVFADIGCLAMMLHQRDEDPQVLQSAIKRMVAELFSNSF